MPLPGLAHQHIGMAACVYAALAAHSIYDQAISCAAAAARLVHSQATSVLH